MASAQKIDVNQTESVSPYIFGHNLEHTRATIHEGLSAQMLRNRKFAGKPSRNEGVAAQWFGIGKKVFFEMDNKATYTRHVCLPKMQRYNELNAQVIQNLAEGQKAGIGQYGIALTNGREYTLRTVTKVSSPVSMQVELTDRSGEKTYASHTLHLAPAEDWTESEWKMACPCNDSDGCIRFTFHDKAEVVLGALSMMPTDNFHGMRKDVVELLKAIGPRLIRWPGGNFAGEYRWKDGLLPVDQRGPLQAATEIETQPYTDGYDYHEMNVDDFIALCREVGAEPMLTINLVWSSPEESAQWVEYCNGAADTEYGKMRAERGHSEPYHVSFWSLGNEMGYRHMEGPKEPAAYAALAWTHAEAMKEKSPGLKLFSSGHYPDDGWAKESGAALADLAEYVSLHRYNIPAGGRHFTTPEGVENTYRQIVASAGSAAKCVKQMRESLDRTGRRLHISFDEWNQWFAWYRPSCVSEGIYTARMMHFLLNESNALDMPVACYFQPVGEGAILITPQGSRLTANGQVFAMMKAHQGGRLCHVQDNGDYSTAATLKDGVLTVTLVNAAYDTPREFDLGLKGQVLETTLYTADEVTPHSYFREAPLETAGTGKSLKATLPPHSVALMRIGLSSTKGR
ncbi:MAG: hypothetical protein ILA34_00740 [Bacteroidaceae bacterium]|nr:hypothetical protein [Bacteroidaceae bacterium]